MGTTVAQKLQFGQEVTAGTAAAATAIWRGEHSKENDPAFLFPTEHVGWVAPTNRVVQADEKGTAKMSGDLSFEQGMYPFEAGIVAVGTGVADGAGSGKIYEYPIPDTTVPSDSTLQPFTLEAGDDQQAEEMAYCICTGFTITGKPQEALHIEADFFGRGWNNTTFTGSIALPTVESVVGGKGIIYLDTEGGTIGTTQISNSFLGMELTVDTGWRPVFTGEGELYLSYFKHYGSSVMLRTTFEHDSNMEAEKTNWLNKLVQQLRISWTGSALGTSGTDYTYKTFQFDAAGMWSKWDPLADQDGNMVSTGIFRCGYSTTADLFATLRLVNEVANLI